MKDPAKKPLSKRPTKTIWLTILALFLLVAGGAVFYAILGAKTALAAENTSHATIVAARVVDAYIREQDPPHWPSSWQDLESVSYDYTWIKWPADREFIKNRVMIDFETTLEDVAKMNDETFDAIQPIGPHYSIWGYDCSLLRETASELLSKSTPSDD